MIILDTTDKTLKVELTSDVAADVEVSYWSISASNVWTPKSHRTNMFSGATTVVLPAPPAGETRVVENMWIQMSLGTGPVSANSVFIIAHDGTPSNDVILGGFSTIVLGSVVTLSRDGLFTLQVVVNT